MGIIDFSKKKESLKRSGRFKVTIKTIEAKNSLFVKYLIEIEETFREGDWKRRVSRSKYYHGSDPKKEAQRIIDDIKNEEKNATNTESYYVD